MLQRKVFYLSIFFHVFIFLSCQTVVTKKENFDNFFSEARHASKQGLLRESLTLLKKAMKLDPSHLEVNLYIASIYLKMQRYKRAKKHLLLVGAGRFAEGAETRNIRQ